MNIKAILRDVIVERIIIIWAWSFDQERVVQMGRAQVVMVLYIILYATCSLCVRQKRKYGFLSIGSCKLITEPILSITRMLENALVLFSFVLCPISNDNSTRLIFPNSKTITKLLVVSPGLSAGGGFAILWLMGVDVGFLKSEDENNYNQFYQIRMLSQYYLIMDGNGLSVHAADHISSRDSRPFLEDIQKALSLSLNLYALAQQESKVRALSESHTLSPLPSTDHSARLNIPMQENNPIPHHYKNVSERKYSSVTGDYFCRNHHDSPKVSPLYDENAPDRSEQCLEEGNGQVAERKIKIKKVSSRNRNRKRLRMVLKGTRVAERGGKGCLRGVVKLLLGSVVPQGHIQAFQLKRKREELMDRWVRSWNPDKEESYIKNREFRMLLRN